jgi:hypothetical protein
MARVNYFKGAETLEDVRMMLIEKLREIDPNSKRLETLNDQFQRACVTYGDKHRSKKGKIYATGKYAKISPAAFSKLVGKIAKMEGVTCYVEGSWIWIKGNTKTYRKELAELGREIAGTGSLRYSGKREEWWYEDKTA